jgi:hypothetical protein
MQGLCFILRLLYAAADTVDACIGFTDQQDRATGSFSRLKYMELTPGLANDFPCHSGVRHMHFATDYDMTVAVPAIAHALINFPVTDDRPVRAVLGLESALDDAHDRIPCWTREPDVETLERQPVQHLFNPRPFKHAPSRRLTQDNVYCVNLCQF